MSPRSVLAGHVGAFWNGSPATAAIHKVAHGLKVGQSPKVFDMLFAKFGVFRLCTSERIVNDFIAE